MLLKLSKWAKIWIAWLLALGILDLIAAIQRTRGKPKPVTFTEHIKHWFHGRWKRALLIGLMALLTWHFAADTGVIPAAVP